MSSSAGDQIQTPTSPPKIATSGVLPGVALAVAIACILVRIRQEHRLYFDDAFFFLAAINIVAGTILIFVDIPFIYVQEDVEAGLQKPPADLMAQLIHSEKFQDAGTVLLATSIFSVKSSFLFFLRHFLRFQKKMMYYWWFICLIVVPSSMVFLFTDFISCDYFDERIIEECTTPQALARESGTLKASVILGVITHSLLISISIVLLWNVQLSLRRKLFLGGILCLSVLTVIIAIIKVSTGKIEKGQVDTAWVIFWLQAEASVALIVVSISALRALFVAKKASRYNNHYQKPSKRRQVDSQAKLWLSRAGHEKSLPSPPSPAHTGARTNLTNCLHDETELELKTRNMELPLQGTDFLGIQDQSPDVKIPIILFQKTADRLSTFTRQGQIHVPSGLNPSTESFV